MPLPILTAANIASLKAVQCERSTARPGQFNSMACRPVWIVGLAGAAKVVVKAEDKNSDTTAADVKWGAKLMRNASDNKAVKAENLTAPELDALCGLSPGPKPVMPKTSLRTAGANLDSTAPLLAA